MNKVTILCITFFSVPTFGMMPVGIQKVRFPENTFGWSDLLLFVIFENGHIATDIFMS